MAHAKPIAGALPLESELKAVLAGRDRLQRDREQRLRPTLPDRREATALVTGWLKASGLDPDEMAKRGAAAREEVRRRAKEALDAGVQDSKGVAAELAAALEGRRRAVERLRELVVAPFVPATVVVDRPFLIWPTNGLELLDSRVEPWNSWARVVAQWRANWGVENVRFVYVWQNPSDRYAVVNVATTLGLNGQCDAFEEGGILSGSVSNLNGYARLAVWEWWNQPPTSPFPQATQSVHVANLAASGGGFLSALGGGTVQSVAVNGAFELTRSLFLMPPGGVGVFEATLEFTYNNFDGGEVQVDFVGGARKVISPALLVTFLS
jgi:hypothetical protein